MQNPPADHGDQFIAEHGAEFLRADALLQQGLHAEAVRVFLDLLEKPSNAFVQSLMWINIAVILDQADQSGEALRAYDNAILLEQSFHGHTASANKACYLAKISRLQESIVIFEELLQRTDLKIEDRDRYAANLQLLRAQQ